MRDYRAILKRTRGNGERQTFKRGAEELRRIAVETFRRIGSGELTGYTAMDIMRDLKLPE